MAKPTLVMTVKIESEVLTKPHKTLRFRKGYRLNITNVEAGDTIIFPDSRPEIVTDVLLQSGYIVTMRVDRGKWSDGIRDALVVRSVMYKEIWSEGGLCKQKYMLRPDHFSSLIERPDDYESKHVMG